MSIKKPTENIEINSKKDNFKNWVNSWEIDSLIESFWKWYFENKPNENKFPEKLFVFLENSAKYRDILLIQKIKRERVIDKNDGNFYSYKFDNLIQYKEFLKILVRVYIDLWNIDLDDSSNFAKAELNKYYEAVEYSAIQQYLKKIFPQIFSFYDVENKEIISETHKFKIKIERIIKIWKK